MFDLTGRVALVAGGTKGIGEAFVRQYVDHGGRVTIAARDGDACRALADTLNARAGKEVAWGHHFDLADTDSIDTLVDSAFAHWGKLDTLFCCSYYATYRKPLEYDDAEFMKSLQLNLVHWMRMAARSLDPLQQSDLARVIFVGSASGVRPHPFNFSYGIAKLGLMRMAQNLAIEWGRFGIRVNTLTPGMTRTPTVMNWLSEEEIPARVAEFPIRRLGLADEIAAGGIYLASPASGFTTGHELVADGGRTLLSGNTGAAFNAAE